ncbi:ABC transporter permease [Rhizobium sp. CG5]|uniref:ABC transporter permease n=1 Tax=Rhizobium sp. CG5 TaxID=2726076 RepID=UPI002034934D|nr:ABC transporter permease [Rhizobium sp. CG5]MCM2477726.1 ABC transporter permease [Rhizobium sp. CG5]
MTSHPGLASALNRVLIGLMLAFLILPVLVVIPVALTDRDYLSLPEHGLSLKHFLSVFNWDAGWLPSMLTSLAIGLVASFFATVLGAAYAVGAWSLGGWWPSMTRMLILSPIIVPPIIYAVGIFKLWAKFRLLDTPIGVVIVHIILCLPFVILAMGSTLSNLDPRMVQAARSLGARPPTVFFKIVVPNIWPGILSAAIFAFITSWDEITVTLFITSRSVITLPRRIWTSIADNVDPALAAVASLMLIVICIGIILQTCFASRRLPPRT